MRILGIFQGFQLFLLNWLLNVNIVITARTDCDKKVLLED